MSDTPLILVALALFGLAMFAVGWQCRALVEARRHAQTWRNIEATIREPAQRGGA